VITQKQIDIRKEVDEERKDVFILILETLRQIEENTRK